MLSSKHCAWYVQVPGTPACATPACFRAPGNTAGHNQSMVNMDIMAVLQSTALVKPKVREGHEECRVVTWLHPYQQTAPATAP